MGRLKAIIEEELGIDISRGPLEGIKTTVGIMKSGLYEAFREGAGERYDTTSDVQDLLVSEILFEVFNVEFYSGEDEIIETTSELIPIAFKKAYEGGVEVK